LLPGTHKREDYRHAGFGVKMRGLFDTFPEWERIEPVPAVMKAGSCSFHNGLTAHAAGPNMTQGTRRALTSAFMPDGSTYCGDTNILSKERLAKLKVGDSLDDDDDNPLVYARPGYVPMNRRQREGSLA
jgi:ectoine hydroxylase-related dioxygenase (phytanoyl-CoA dioxygenase family)